MTQSFSVEGLTCAHCATKIERKVREAPDVLRAELNFVARTLTVETRGEELPANLQGIIQSVEPEARILKRSELPETPLLERLEDERRAMRIDLARLVAGSVLFLVSILTSFSSRYALGLSLIAYGVIGYPVLLASWKKAMKRNLFNENFLMTLATICAFLIGQPAEAVGVMVFYEIGELLNAYALNRSRYRIFGLLTHEPETVTAIKEGNATVVHPREVLPGESFIVKPGERVLLDGEIEKGEALIDTSSLTGEPVPRTFGKGDEVLSGFINTNATLRIRATKRYEDSTLSRTLSLIEEAALKKSRTERSISRFASVYTPAVVFGALALATLPPILFGLPFESWLYRALVLLVISCPCALVLSVPLASFVAIGKLSKQGILVKGSDFFRTLKKAKSVVFDKTGTLTAGLLKIDRVTAFLPHTQEQVIHYAAIAEYHSSHPIARALRDGLPEGFSPDEITQYQEYAGSGLSLNYRGTEILVGSARFLESRDIRIKGQADAPEALTTVLVAVDGVHAGTVYFSDSERPDSAELIAFLRDRGLKTFLLTGDRAPAAKEVAQRLGLDGYFSELSPKLKIEEYEKIRDQTGQSLFIGDGVNDAPVLRRADVGVAFGGKNSDITLESADIVIPGEEIKKVKTLFESADRHAKILWQNILLILGIKGLFLLLGGFGLSSLWEAVFADVGVTLLCVLNTFRLS